MLRRIIYLFTLAIVLTGCTGQILEQGKSSYEQQDYTTSFKKMLPLATNGNADAEYAVGYMYYYGKGIPEDQQEGEQWIRKAAAQGQPQAIQAAALFDKLHRTNAPDPLTTMN